MAEKTTDPIEIDPKDIKELMKFYGFQDNLVYDPYVIFDEVEPKAAYTSEVLRCLIMHHYNETKLPNELFSLIEFLNTCKGSPLKLTSTITNKRGNELNGQEKSTTISNEYILTILELFVNTWYDKKVDRLFFPVAKKQPLKSNHSEFLYGEEVSSIFDFTEPYDDDEICKISKYINDTKCKDKITNNTKLGIDAGYFLALIKWCNIQGNKTKLYSFVYDLMRLAKHTGKKCITEEGFSGDTGREKAIQIKNWIKSYTDKEVYKCDTIEEYFDSSVRLDINVLFDQGKV